MIFTIEETKKLEELASSVGKHGEINAKDITKRSILNMLSKLDSIEKMELVRNTLQSIIFSDTSKIKKVNEEYYKNDSYLEEQMSPIYPTITVRRSGIGSFLTLNGVDCSDDSIEY